MFHSLNLLTPYPWNTTHRTTLENYVIVNSTKQMQIAKPNFYAHNSQWASEKSIPRSEQNPHCSSWR